MNLLPNCNESRTMQHGVCSRETGWGGGDTERGGGGKGEREIGRERERGRERESTSLLFTAVSTGCLFQNESYTKLTMDIANVSTE